MKQKSQQLMDIIMSEKQNQQLYGMSVEQLQQANHNEQVIKDFMQKLKSQEDIFSRESYRDHEYYQDDHLSAKDISGKEYL